MAAAWSIAAYAQESATMPATSGTTASLPQIEVARVKPVDQVPPNVRLSDDLMSQRLASIPGIGPIIATAIATTVADPNVFRSGREFAAWLGLVPRQNSTGGKIRLGGITKRGNRYLRRLLINGASANLLRSKATKADPWVIGLRRRRPPLVVAVALANKTARGNQHRDDPNQENASESSSSADRGHRSAQATDAAKIEQVRPDQRAQAAPNISERRRLLAGEQQRNDRRGNRGDKWNQITHSKIRSPAAAKTRCSGRYATGILACFTRDSEASL
jgi:hypothetical protein